MSPQKKYLFVGLTCTGPWVCAQAMQQMGITTVHFPKCVEELNRVDCLTDTPVAMWFRQGKFSPWYGKNLEVVLTIRDPGDWLQACQIWFGSRPLETLDPFTWELRNYLYGTPLFDWDLFRAAYHKHEDMVERICNGNHLKLHKLNVLKMPYWEFFHVLTGKPMPIDEQGNLKQFPLPPQSEYRYTTWGQAITEPNVAD